MFINLFILNLKALSAHLLKFRRKKAGIGKMILLGLLAAYILFVLFFSFYMMFNFMLEPLYAGGWGWLYFAVLALSVFIISVFSTIITASTQQFGAKDNELLLSMPIKPSTILLSRLLVLLLFEYVFELTAALPAFLLWLDGGYATGAGILFFLIGIIFLPLMAMATALLLFWILGVIMSRIRHKNIIAIIFTIGFLIGHSFIFTVLQQYLVHLINNGNHFAESFRRSMPPFYAFGRSIAEGSILYGFYFVLWAAVPFAAMIILLSIFYRKILTSNRGIVKKAYKEKSVKLSRPLTALIRRELAQYISKPFVVLNTSIVSIFMLILTVVLLFNYNVIVYLFDALNGIMDLPYSYLVAAILAVMIVSNNISASLISLEGRNLWIVKSIPVHAETVLQSKLYTHILLHGLPGLVSSPSHT